MSEKSLLDPRAAYTDRLAARRATVASLDARIDRVGGARVVVFLAAVVAAAVGWFGGAFSPWWGALGVVPLGALVLVTKLLAHQRARAAAAVRYYRHALDRLDGTWIGRGPTGDQFADPNHLYAADLDLFGRGSLFQRLCAARTADGQRVLAGWLLAPAGAEEVVARQGAVADLRGRLDLREYLAVTGGPAAADVTALAAWGEAPLRTVLAWRRTAVLMLGWFNLLAAILWLAGETTSLPLLIGAVVSAIVVWPLMGWSREVARPVEDALNDLPLLEAILARLEREPFSSPRLLELQQSLTAGGASAANRVRDLRAIGDWSTARRNPLFLPVAILMLWDVRTALKLDRWRTRSGTLVAKWLAAAAELEALGSLAGYAFENPGDPFPDVRAGGEPGVEANRLGHPLLPADRCVRNDVAIGGPVRLLMISGSNMSGKSTLLRSLGVNIVLALAGGPVRAERLALTPVALGATIRVQDSLHDGKSRFYAEVTRVRAVLDRVAGALPVLFLFDELFSGTNSADRVLGAEAVIRKLLDIGAIGLVTTHDLALTAATVGLGSRAVNIHFADQFEDGKMTFDYTIRPGVVPHGNGVALMRAVGLDV
ncbi:MutS-related protein [Fimbriiglobus ruber]|uniref:MutS-related protein n=1 Tax=Fimbriiglobus ruber TaxID=1908690 RepID=UPI001930FEFC|nr:hypothetical protein [Fimbriiglobus ruber]